MLKQLVRSNETLGWIKDGHVVVRVTSDWCNRQLLAPLDCQSFSSVIDNVACRDQIQSAVVTVHKTGSRVGPLGTTGTEPL